MKYYLAGKRRHNSFLTTSSNLVKDAGDDLLKFIGRTRDEVSGMEAGKVFFDFLKLPADFLEQIGTKGRTDCFLFTKALKAREVTISLLQDASSEDKTYIIIEKPDSRIEKRFPYLDLSSLKNISAIAVYSADLTLLKANQVYLDLLDEPFNLRENSIGRSLFQIFEIFIGTDSETHWKHMAKTGESLNVTEIALKKSNGRITYWNASCVPVYENGKIKYFIHSANEVTEKVLNRKRIEEQNREIQLQKEYLETIMDNTSDFLFLLDRDGNFLHINKAGQDFLKPFKPDNFKDLRENSKAFDLDGKEMPLDNMPTFKALRGEKADNKQVIILLGEVQKYFNISANPVFDSSNNLIQVVTVARDITLQVRMEMLQKATQQQMIELEKGRNEVLQKSIEIKDEFLSIVSHEFKTPITVINSAVQAMETLCKNELSSRAKGFLDKIRQNSNRQLKLVNNLLDITRINSGYLKINKTDLDIVELTRSITESISIFAEQKRISLSFYSTMTRKMTRVDGEKYERILLNLLSNAIKFTPEGKSIAVRVSQKIIQKKYCICLQVKDTGVGIPRDKRESIFERFFQVDSSLTRKAEGTGIGLYLVKMLVEMIDGKIILHSREGYGSTFEVVFPFEKAKGKSAIAAVKKQYDERLMQSTAIEFSDISI